MKTIIIAALALFTTCMIDYAEDTTLQPVPYVQGLNTLKDGDSIRLAEVLASTPRFAVGDIVTVKGSYTLSSQPSARLGFLCTGTKGGGRGPTLTPTTQRMTVRQGEGKFEITQTIKHHGCLHLTFYDETTGMPLGGFYFGTKEQVEEIETLDKMQINRINGEQAGPGYPPQGVGSPDP